MPALGHDGLFTLANKVHAAAQDADPERLEAAARRFADMLGSHLRDEAPALARLTPADARILRRGQQRLVAAAEAVLEQACERCAHAAGRCTAHTEELLALVVLQTSDERRSLHESAA
jgi:hypothetical protein